MEIIIRIQIETDGTEAKVTVEQTPTVASPEEWEAQFSRDLEKAAIQFSFSTRLLNRIKNGARLRREEYSEGKWRPVIPYEMPFAFRDEQKRPLEFDEWLRRVRMDKSRFLVIRAAGKVLYNELMDKTS